MSDRNWLQQVSGRQRNVAPEDTIRNDALVEGTLIRGGKRFPPIQRIGALFLGGAYFSLGAVGLATSAFMLQVTNYSLLARIGLFVAGVSVASLFLIAGGRMVRNGVTGGITRRVRVSRSRKGTRHKTSGTTP